MYSSKLLPEVEKYLDSLSKKERDKSLAFMELLEEHDGVLDEPYSKHLRPKIRELIVNLGKADHRFLYTLLPEKIILYLVAFRKKTRKTDPRIVKKAIILREMYLGLKNKNH